jgi:hypothetical protein
LVSNGPAQQLGVKARQAHRVGRLDGGSPPHSCRARSHAPSVSRGKPHRRRSSWAGPPLSMLRAARGGRKRGSARPPAKPRHPVVAKEATRRPERGRSLS